jgi:acyl-CoA thioesterase I
MMVHVMKLIISLILPALLLTACQSATGNHAQLRPLPTDAVILAFGDSITFGTGAAPGQDYPATLRHLISRTVLNAGIPGEVTAEGRARLPGLLDNHRPALLLLCLGANDMLRGLDEENAAENLRAMVRMAGDRGIQVVLIGYPRPPRFTTTPEFYDRIAAEFSIPYLNNTLGGILKDPSLKADSIHPNALGYRKLAEKLADLLHTHGAL